MMYQDTKLSLKKISVEVSRARKLYILHYTFNILVIKKKHNKSGMISTARKATNVLRKGSGPLKRFTSDLQNTVETQNFYMRRGD